MTMFNPADPAFIEDPYPTYRRLRDEAPVWQDPDSGLWLITRFSGVERATADYASFSSAKGNVVQDSPTRVGKTLGSIDPPRHDELRRVIQRGLGNARIEAMLPGIRIELADCMALLSEKRECDFIADISQPILFGALGRMLGLDAEAAVKATKLTKGLFHQDDGPLGSILPPEIFMEIATFLRDQLDNRRQARGDDLISVLLSAKENGAPLSDEEIVANVSTVLMAGNASIGHFFPNVMHALWRHPDQRRMLLDDPGRIPAAIDEAVRWDTSTQCFARQVAQEVEIDGALIPADSRAIIFYASANRDERVIADPDRFDISRARVRHFGFGMGPHFCAGANAARLMLKEIMRELLPYLGDYELDIGKAKRVSHIMVRGFANLPMSW
ncbi:cytochrome P450 [Niveispirillum sp. KHB5.9]|uniref:cytochrome P450 n=1 Tax=Niveispirillum sp. KHB5.9 TaxID=3400269 RepID=UPI003A84CDF3